jgi:UDP-GlcNAc:undecaprenyl-phosphate GlcNAc-1-phosphate transferase
MPVLMSYLICLLGGAALTAVLLPFTHLLAPAIGAMDYPVGARRMHRRPIPRCGGLAMLVAFWGVLLVVGCVGEELLPLLIGSVALVLIGLPDDVFGVPALLKLVVQLLASVLVVLGLGWDTPALVAAVVWLVLLINAHNMIDGIDGLAATTVAIESGALALLLRDDPKAVAVALALLGICLGYLPYNRHPAHLFMGDEGALLLGLLVGWLTLRLPDAGQGTAQSWRAIVICLLPLLDLTLSVGRRLLQGKNPLCADRGHLHHMLADHGCPVRVVCRWLCIPCAIAALLAVML